MTNEDYFSRTLHPNKNKKNLDNSNIENRISITIFEEKYENQENDDNIINNKKDFYNQFYILLRNPLYIISSISGSIIRGLITCLNYWYPDFLRNIVKKEKIQLTMCYTLVSLMGPFGGIIANGVLKKYIGNYEGKKVFWPLVVLQLIASIFAISIGLMKSLISVCIVTICYLIFNSTVLALIQGIIISSVDKKLSATGFAFANICKQIISGPIPMIYGVINDKYKEEYPFFAMLFVMSINFLSIPLLISLAILRTKKNDDDNDKENQNDIELIEK
jgi:hypothetical protein